MTHIEAWFKAFRLRTLPLSFSSVILGSLLALWQNSFQLEILIGALITTLFLQILSNLANDYGDFQNGVDNEGRIGPARTLQSGDIKANQMKIAIVIIAILAFLSGLWLLWQAAQNIGLVKVLTFIGIGVLAIAAAIKYTIGKKPYGYSGFGDVAVFLFFGLTGVGGTYYLHANNITWSEILPAVSIGLLATGVLNVNNMRDVENDKKTGKRSLVVMMGIKRAKIYHTILILGAIATAIVFTVIHFQSYYQLLFLITLPMLIQHIAVVRKNEHPSELDGELKKLALGTLVFALTLGIGLNY